MKKFPSYLRVNNKDNFLSILETKICEDLRNEILQFLLHRENDETIYFTYEDFTHKYKHILDINEKIIPKIIKELEEIGWKCKLSYGQTVMFIYSTEKEPINCYSDEF